MALEPAESPTDAEGTSDRRQIPLLKTTVAAFVGRTERGPLNEPVAVHGFEDFRRVFGGHRSFSFVSHAVYHYFLHGGRRAVVVRVANRATRGRIDLPAGEDTLTLQACQPGSRELLRVSVDYDGALTEDHFNLVIQRMSRPGAGFIEDQELFLGLSMSETDDRYAADALRVSNLVRVEGPLPAKRPDATRAAHPGQAIPYVYMTVPGSDGEDLTDYDVIGSNSERTGLFALDAVERIDLLCLPPGPGRDLGTTTFLAAARYCERRRAMLVWDPPWAWRSADTALLGMRGSVQASGNALISFPRLTMRGDVDRYPDGLPACGAVAGMLARNDRSGAWRALAGADAALKGGLRPVVEVDARQAARLERAGMNVIRRSETGHHALQGNVSLVGAGLVAPALRRLDRARLALFILGSVERAAGIAAEPAADAESAPTLARRIERFLAALHEHGALAGKHPEQAYFVRPPAQQPDRVGVRFGFTLRAGEDFLAYELDASPAGGVVARPIRAPVEAASAAIVGAVPQIEDRG